MKIVVSASLPCHQGGGGRKALSCFRSAGRRARLSGLWLRSGGADSDKLLQKIEPKRGTEAQGDSSQEQSKEFDGILARAHWPPPWVCCATGSRGPSQG